jgi:hypothetical protein
LDLWWTQEKNWEAGIHMLGMALSKMLRVDSDQAKAKQVLAMGVRWGLVLERNPIQ